MTQLTNSLKESLSLYILLILTFFATLNNSSLDIKTII